MGVGECFVRDYMRFVTWLAKLMIVAVRATISILFTLVSRTLSQLLKIAAIYRLGVHPIFKEILRSFTRRYEARQRSNDNKSTNRESK